MCFARAWSIGYLDRPSNNVSGKIFTPSQFVNFIVLATMGGQWGAATPTAVPSCLIEQETGTAVPRYADVSSSGSPSTVTDTDEDDRERGKI